MGSGVGRRAECSCEDESASRLVWAPWNASLQSKPGCERAWRFWRRERADSATRPECVRRTGASMRARQHLPAQAHARACIRMRLHVDVHVPARVHAGVAARVHARERVAARVHARVRVHVRARAPLPRRVERRRLCTSRELERVEGVAKRFLKRRQQRRRKRRPPRLCRLHS
eukprot:5636763-Pleurochrysis_carterae.AAC.2